MCYFLFEVVAGPTPSRMFLSLRLSLLPVSEWQPSGEGRIGGLTPCGAPFFCLFFARFLSLSVFGSKVQAKDHGLVQRTAYPT